MPEPRARALLSAEPLEALPRASLRARAADVLRFAARPTPYHARHAWNAALVAALASIFAMHLAVDWAAVWLLEAWDDRAGLLPAPQEETRPFGTMVFSAVVLAPVLEEALHRGWMSGQIAALRFAAYGFAATGCLLAGLAVGEQGRGLCLLLAVMIALAGFVRWLQTRERDRALPAWFTRHFAALVWAGSLFFAAIHLGAYEPLTHPLGVLVVTPQLIGGLFLAYVRTRLGLRAAMLHHAAYNAVALAIMMEPWS
ncbi:MAG: type II CAAX prenyl endopeptidase Rce1 family protein [Erythrobacter sp.]